MQEIRDRVALAPLLDLGLLAIQLGVKHRVRPVAIGLAFQELGAFAIADRVHRFLDCRFDREHIHAVHDSGGHALGRSLAGDVRHGLVKRKRSAHAVVVVFTYEQQRDLPQRSQVERLLKLAFGCCAVAEKADGDAIAPQPHIGQRHAQRLGQAGRHDAVASVEARLGVEQMHRPAAPPAAPLLLAEHLGHDGARWNALRQSLAMLAIGGHHCVVLVQVLHHAHGDRFFAVIEVHEAANLHGAIHLRRLLLQPPNAHHLPQQALPVLAIQLTLLNRRLAGCGLCTHQSPPVVVDCTGRQASFRPPVHMDAR